MQRSQDLELLVRETIDAMAARDLAAVERMLSRSEGSVMIGSDASEYTRDIDEMLRIMRESMPNQTHITFSVNEVYGYSEGHVGWFDGTVGLMREGGSVEARITGVAHRERDQWRFVQMHLSIGVPNEHMFEPMFQQQAAMTS